MSRLVYVYFVNSSRLFGFLILSLGLRIRSTNVLQVGPIQSERVLFVRSIVGSLLRG
jgi:hypothetical protein